MNASGTAVPRRNITFLLALVLLAVLLAYTNHFENAFHFDDFHTITDNPWIRSVGNIPRFFTDANTSSTLPANRVYRPLLTTSSAIDYWLGGGLKPFFFHLSTFLWFLLQIVLMFFLFRTVFDRVRPDPLNLYIALFGAAWYGLHPANAETVNYINQRADLYSTLGVVAGLYLYASRPAAAEIWAVSHTGGVRPAGKAASSGVSVPSVLLRISVRAGWPAGPHERGMESVNTVVCRCCRRHGP